MGIANWYGAPVVPAPEVNRANYAAVELVPGVQVAIIAPNGWVYEGVIARTYEDGISVVPVEHLDKPASQHAAGAWERFARLSDVLGITRKTI